MMEDSDETKKTDSFRDIIKEFSGEEILDIINFTVDDYVMLFREGLIDYSHYAVLESFLAKIDCAIMKSILKKKEKK